MCRVYFHHSQSAAVPNAELCHLSFLSCTLPLPLVTAFPYFQLLVDSSPSPFSPSLLLLPCSISSSLSCGKGLLSGVLTSFCLPQVLLPYSHVFLKTASLLSTLSGLPHCLQIRSKPQRPACPLHSSFDPRPSGLTLCPLMLSVTLWTHTPESHLSCQRPPRLSAFCPQTRFWANVSSLGYSTSSIFFRKALFHSKARPSHLLHLFACLHHHNDNCFSHLTS